MCLPNLKQFCNILNVNQKVLDLIMPNFNNDPALRIVMNIPISRSLPPNSYTKLRFANANYRIINDELQNYNWKEALSSPDVNTCVCKLYGSFDTVIQSHVTTKTIIIKYKYPI
ncbi:hypothetical protein JTB14_027854 [Gonioctena quinquepunctata]|nr:hypothetical protein JTB14_027854 [Gonioctena quinquepunctata]